MRVLGIEGTAHTCGVGLVEADPDEPARCRVLANRVAMLRPETGGIHPREAADHHVEALPGLVRAAFDDAGLRPGDLDGVAFSQGPGLGPCLRTVATAARAIAVRHALPLAGVNHCVAHLEIGRATTGAEDPVMLYASGANTQVIAEAGGRYRVFGETLDVGIGNALDKFARAHGMPFPGGPRIEELAARGRAERQAGGTELPTLPYSVKGMDLTFSGTVKAASRLIKDGATLESACDALQEWAFAMLVEVTERAVAHTEKAEVLLGGGVARNRRLQGMLSEMAGARGAGFHCPEPALLSDNGAMIAWNGLLALRAGRPTPVGASFVDQKQRTDDVDLVWRAPSPVLFRGHAARDGQVSPGAEGVMARGAEAEIRLGRFQGRDVVLKMRTPKRYRDPAIERLLVGRRVRRETRHTTEAARAGTRVPRVYDADPAAGVIVFEQIEGRMLKEAIADPGTMDAPRVLEALGSMVGRLHAQGLVHGDLTTSNVMVTSGGEPVLLDFGLAERTVEAEPRAVDLHVLQEALQATHADGGDGPGALWTAFTRGYQEAWPDADRVLGQLDALRARGRYMSAHQ